ncbi:hypothetical protein GALL_474520 [mine drainage metagenome]|uniref:Uncharacterized protein n=1 Tax=mine drainage metagenome TaxID=410659 RepID=A0A1J5PT79_9ZZZZ
MAYAAAREEYVLPLSQRPGLRNFGCRYLLLAPSGKFNRRLCDHMKCHMRVLCTAIFGALTSVIADFVRLQPGIVIETGDDIHLARQLRYPERVDDIGGCQVDTHGLADRNMDFVSGGKDTRWLVTVVSDFPPPLVCGHVERQRWRTRRRGNGDDGENCPHGAGKQHRGRYAHADVYPRHATGTPVHRQTALRINGGFVSVPKNRNEQQYGNDDCHQY